MDDLIKKFKEEIKKSLLMADEDKPYWLSQADSLSQGVLAQIYALVKQKNDLVQQYIRTALANDPDHAYLTELKNTIKNIKASSLHLEEKAEDPDAEALLEQKLANL